MPCWNRLLVAPPDSPGKQRDPAKFCLGDVGGSKALGYQTGQGKRNLEVWGEWIASWWLN